MPPQTSSTPSEIDIWFNRASLSLAKSERIASSLLPPPTESELRNTKTEDQIRQEEQEMFTVAPDLLGVGAPILLKDGSQGTTSSIQTATDKLRRQLLGTNYTKVQGMREATKSKDGSKSIKLGASSSSSSSSSVANDPTKRLKRSSNNNNMGKFAKKSKSHHTSPHPPEPAKSSRSTRHSDSDDEPGRSSLGKGKSRARS